MEVGIETIQRMCFEVLCDIDAYCREHNILYLLSGGTCLGAIRHKGFIPWDDDADIMLPREDYDRLLSGFEQEYREKYSVGSLDKTEKWVRTYARIWRNDTELDTTSYDEMTMGIFVDVFPMDGVPQGKGKRKRYFRRLWILEQLRRAAVRKEFRDRDNFHGIKRILGLVARPFGGRFFAVRLDRMAKKYDFYDSDDVGAVMACHYWDKEVIARNCLDRAVEKEFCGRLLPVPIGFDRYLTNLYGDYIVMPDDDVRYHSKYWKIRIKDDIEDTQTLGSKKENTDKSMEEKTAL